jgi:hypothetical protein
MLVHVIITITVPALSPPAPRSRPSEPYKAGVVLVNIANDGNLTSLPPERAVQQELNNYLSLSRYTYERFIKLFHCD